MIDVIEFKLTDDQWANVCRFVALPEEARAGLDNTASLYLMFEKGRKKNLSNSIVKRGLEQISDTAAKLARLMNENLGEHVVSMLLDPARLGDAASPTHMIEGQKLLAQHVRTVSTLETWCRDVAAWIPKQPPGRDTGNLDWLVDQAAQAFTFHTGLPFVDQPGRRKYISNFVKAVDPGAGAKEGSIDSAIDAIGAGPK